MIISSDVMGHVPGLQSVATAIGTLYRRSARYFRRHAFEPEFGQIERIDERVQRANRIALIDPIIEAFGQQNPRSAPTMKRFIRSSRKSRENLTARIKSSDAFSRSQGHSRPRRYSHMAVRFRSAPKVDINSWNWPLTRMGWTGRAPAPNGSQS